MPSNDSSSSRILSGRIQFHLLAFRGGSHVARTSRIIGGPTQHPTATIAVRMNNERRRNCGRGMGALLSWPRKIRDYGSVNSPGYGIGGIVLDIIFAKAPLARPPAAGELPGGMIDIDCKPIESDLLYALLRNSVRARRITELCDCNDERREFHIWRGFSWPQMARPRCHQDLFACDGPPKAIVRRRRLARFSMI